MTATLSPTDKAKLAAAERAVDFVRPGMRLGLGTGSTAEWMVRCLGERVREGLRVSAVATSARTADLAREMGIPLVSLDEVTGLDLTIDGADEVDPALNLIKGGGAALLQEKIVAAASDQMIVIADAGKEVAQLGRFPLPVEIVRFGWKGTQAQIARVLADHGLPGCEVVLRQTGGVSLVTDEGHCIADLHLGRIADAPALALALNRIPGVVETGLFIGLCDLAIIGHSDGTTVLRERPSARVAVGAQA